MRSPRDWLASSHRVKLCRNLGFWNALRYTILSRRLQRDEGEALVHLRSKYSRHPLYCRPATTDILVFDQIFIEREYQSLDALSAPELIIDCGANVGYSSAYFLSRFPHAKLLAVEPDPGNIAVLERNLSHYRPRAEAFMTGVWSHCTKLTLADSPFRDGAEWSRQVRECRPGETGFEAIDVGTLLAHSGCARISLLKMDIEGAEAVVFSRNYESWLAKVDNIAIELHADSPFGDAHKAFLAAIQGRGFQIKEAGELTLCLR